MESLGAGADKTMCQIIKLSASSDKILLLNLRAPAPRGSTSALAIIDQNILFSVGSHLRQKSQGTNENNKRQVSFLYQCSLSFVRWQYNSVRKQLNSVVVVVKFEIKEDVGKCRQIGL